MFELPEQTGRYLGAERRKGTERRMNGIRREEFRFEPGKNDRRNGRNGRDRRKQSGWGETTIFSR